MGGNRGGQRLGAGRKSLFGHPMVTKVVSLSLEEKVLEKLQQKLKENGQQKLASYLRELVEKDLDLS
jgi:hypothetical protein